MSRAVDSRPAGARVHRLMAAAAMLTWGIAVGQPQGAGCRVAHYRLAEVPLKPSAINAHGAVAGTDSRYRAAVWSAKGGLHELPIPSGFEYSEATSINDRGQVVGMVYDRDYTRHRAFHVHDGVVDLLEGGNARALHIDDSNAVGGEAVLPGSVRSQPVVWNGGRVQKIDSCCGGLVRHLAKDGAVGDAYDESGRFYAFRWTPREGLKRIGPGAGYSSTVAANDRGHAVIEVLTRVFLYADDALTRIELTPKGRPHARGIDTCDLMVGASGPFPDSSHAFAWDRIGGYQDLNRRLVTSTNWTLHVAAAVNDAGLIAGIGGPPGHGSMGFLLTPE